MKCAQMGLSCPVLVAERGSRFELKGEKIKTSKLILPSSSSHPDYDVSRPCRAHLVNTLSEHHARISLMIIQAVKRTGHVKTAGVLR